MNGFMKGMLVVLIMLYVISPIDLVPGPIDDIIAILLGFAANRRLLGPTSAE